LAAEGVANSEIAERLGVCRPTVIAWRKRYSREGLSGRLADRHRRGRPQTVRRTRRAEILAATLTPPPEHLGVTTGPRGCWRPSWRSAIARWRGSGPSTTSGHGRSRRSSSPPTRSWRPSSATWSGCTWTRRRTRSCCGWMRSPRFRRWSAPSQSGRWHQDGSSGAPTTTCATAPPPCSPPWRWPPVGSPTPATTAPPPRVPGLPQAGRQGLPAPAAACGGGQLWNS
jgi:hypothetical protein